MNRYVLLAIVALIVLAAGGWWWQATRGIPVQASRATLDTVRQYVDENGTTRLEQVHTITMPFAARISEITLREGDAVTSGQVVAQVAPSDLENELAEATAAVERLDAAIRENDDVTVERSLHQQAELFVQSMANTVQAAEAQMTSGKKQLDVAETFLARTQRLFQTQANTQEDLDQAELRHVESQVEFQQDRLIFEAMRSIEAATRLLPQMVGQYIDRKDLSRAVLEKQRSEAQARLRQVQTRLHRGRMASPVDGIVLEREIRNEQYLPAGAELLQIGDLQQLEVEADLLSEDAADVRPRDPVEIYGPGIGRSLGHGVAGRVDRVFPYGFTKISSLGVEQQRVKIIVRLPADVVQQLVGQAEIGVGYRVRVRVFTDQHDQVVTVPRTALFRGADGGWQVYAIRRGRANLQPIEVGLLNDERAEITAGVQQGEAVVLAPENSLTHGTRVRPIIQ